MDNSNVIVPTTRVFGLNLLKSINSIMVYIESFLRGVTVLRGCRFFGHPIIVRVPGSTIKIGNQCTFRSDRSSNLIGVKGKCIISASSKDAQLIIGNNSGFSGAVLVAFKKIQIGNNVLVGANVTITDSDCKQRLFDSAEQVEARQKSFRCP